MQMGDDSAPFAMAGQRSFGRPTHTKATKTQKNRKQKTSKRRMDKGRDLTLAREDDQPDSAVMGKQRSDQLHSSFLWKRRESKGFKAIP
jgi:hypothetical protein